MVWHAITARNSRAHHILRKGKQNEKKVQNSDKNISKAEKVYGGILYLQILSKKHFRVPRFSFFNFFYT